MSNLHGNFPDDFASDREKESLTYGKDVGEAICGQWFNGQLNARRRWIQKMRRYSKGEQDTDYKRMIEGSRKKDRTGIDVKTHKIDYSRLLKIMPVFKDIVINAIDESLFKPRAEAIDTSAVNEKKEYFDRIENDFYTQDFNAIISQGIGINLTPDDVAKNQKELNLKKLDFKPNIEIAQELAIENVFKHQKLEGIKDKIDEDIFDLGIGVGKHYTDRGEGIKLGYTDVYNFIHSSFQMDDARDLRYAGEAEEGTIASLINMCDRKLTEDELLAIKNHALQDYNNLEPYNESEDGHRVVEYFRFAYKMSMSRVFKRLNKNKSVRLIDRSKDEKVYNPKNPKKKLQIAHNVWFEGVYIPHAKVMIKWKPVPNQVEKETGNPVCPYVVYAPKVKRNSETGNVRFDSMVERAIPILDDIQIDWYKLRQLKSELRPNTTEINIDAISNITLNNKKISPQDVLDLFFGRGIMLRQTYDEDGDPIDRAVKEEASAVNYSGLQFLGNEFANNLSRLRQLTGINELRDGTTKPNSRTSATVQKLLLASSNNSTNHIVKASFYISLAFAEGVSLRIIDVLGSKSLKDMYMNIIGTDNVDLLESIKRIPLHKFGIYFDFRPDNDERIAFEQSLISALNKGEINSAQYNKARQVRNSKSANKYLESVIEENQQRAEQQKIANSQAQAQANAQSTVVAEQARQQTLTMQWQIKQQEMLLQDQIEERKEKRKALLENALDAEKHERRKEIANITTSGQMEKVEFIERAKSERIDQASSNESAKIEQREKGLPRIDFENRVQEILQDELPNINEL